MHTQQRLIYTNKMHTKMQDVRFQTLALTLKHTKVDTFKTTVGITLIPKLLVLM